MDNIIMARMMTATTAHQQQAYHEQEKFSTRPWMTDMCTPLHESKTNGNADQNGANADETNRGERLGSSSILSRVTDVLFGSKGFEGDIYKDATKHWADKYGTAKRGQKTMVLNDVFAYLSSRQCRFLVKEKDEATSSHYYLVVTDKERIMKKIRRTMRNARKNQETKRSHDTLQDGARSREADNPIPAKRPRWEDVLPTLQEQESGSGSVISMIGEDHDLPYIRFVSADEVGGTSGGTTVLSQKTVSASFSALFDEIEFSWDDDTTSVEDIQPANTNDFSTTDVNAVSARNCFAPEQPVVPPPPAVSPLISLELPRLPSNAKPFPGQACVSPCIPSCPEQHGTETQTTCNRVADQSPFLFGPLMPWVIAANLSMPYSAPGSNAPTPAFYATNIGTAITTSSGGDHHGKHPTGLSNVAAAPTANQSDPAAAADYSDVGKRAWAPSPQQLMSYSFSDACAMTAAPKRTPVSTLYSNTARAAGRGPSPASLQVLNVSRNTPVHLAPRPHSELMIQGFMELEKRAQMLEIENSSMMKRLLELEQQMEQGTPTMKKKPTVAARKRKPTANKGKPTANKRKPAANKGKPTANKGKPAAGNCEETSEQQKTSQEQQINI